MTATLIQTPTQGARQRLFGWRKPAALPSELRDCALAVPTFRRPAILIRLLEKVLALADAPGEIVVVDGSPDDEVGRRLAGWAQAQDLPFDLVYIKSPAGLTLQRNVSIDAIEKDYVFFLDDDCLPEPGYFRHIRQVFVEDIAGGIGGVRGFLTNGIDQPLTVLWRLRFALGLAQRGQAGKYYDSGTSGSWNGVEPFSGIRPVDVLAGGAAAYRREVFARHRFSQFFYGYAQGEDLEMSRRISRDWKLVVCGDAFVDHHHAEGGRPAGFARARMAMRNRYFIWKRHSPRAKALDRCRFWMDHLLIISYNLLRFLQSPRQPAYAAYASGTLYGLVECLLTPPRYQEPAARREYMFELETLEARKPACKLS